MRAKPQEKLTGTQWPKPEIPAQRRLLWGDANRRWNRAMRRERTPGPPRNPPETRALLLEKIPVLSLTPSEAVSFAAIVDYI